MGWGFMNYDRYDRQYQVRVGDLAVTNDGTSHNTYLSILAEMGLIGLTFYLIPMFWWLFLTIRHWGELPQYGFWSRSLVLSLWVVIMHMFIVTNSMDMIRHHEFGTTLWWMALGLIGNVVAPYFSTEQTGPTRLRPTPT